MLKLHTNATHSATTAHILNKRMGVLENKLQKTSLGRGRFVKKSEISECESCGKPHRKTGSHPYLATHKVPKNLNDYDLSA